MYQTPESQYHDMEDVNTSITASQNTATQLIPSDLWNVQYLLLVPGALQAASVMNPARVAEVFAQSANPQAPITSSLPPAPIRLTAPPIAAYDGESRSLRTFCSQLVNQIQDNERMFPTEISKVRFAYQCLGPGALVKMRSYFRCLEDATIPAEINNLAEFIEALKRQCQDPSLEDRATRTVETMTQGNMKFQEFITLFEDSMTDSTYASVDKEVWKKMLKRRLSYNLRNILLSASDVPESYHELVTYLRKKDAAIQELKIAFPSKTHNTAPVSTSSTPPKPTYVPPFLRNKTNQPLPTLAQELTVSQGGTAMDLDTLSKERGPDGRLTQQARSARRSLGRCYRCNKEGHLAVNCPLGNSSVPIISGRVNEVAQSEPLKD